MIAQLTGTIVRATLTELILDVHGVGYRVAIPLSTYDVLPEQGKLFTILTHMQVREDGMSLFGFAKEEERAVFELLITVNGIGAKTAMNILSSLNIPGFCAALAGSDVKALKRINGVGPKSAERMIVELRDKVDQILPQYAFGTSTPASQDPQVNKHAEDALMALEQLGFQRAKIQKTVLDIASELPEQERSPENIIRKSLQFLNK